MYKDLSILILKINRIMFQINCYITGSSPHSQEPTTCPYPEPDRSSPCPLHPTTLRSILILSSHLRLGLPSSLLPSGFPTKTLYARFLSPIRSTSPAYLCWQYITKFLFCIISDVLTDNYSFSIETCTSNYRTASVLVVYLSLWISACAGSY